MFVKGVTSIIGVEMAKNHVVFIVLDSCRYDSMMTADTPNIDRIGNTERRYSYASWTAPSHYAFTMGMLPHKSPRDVFASEVYRRNSGNGRAHGIGGDRVQGFPAEDSLPKVLSKLGYYTVAKVSMRY
jgi:hypothetical protein